MVKNKKSVRKNKEVNNSIKKIKGLEQKIKENPDVIKVHHNDILVDIIDNKDDKNVDIDKEIDEILKLSNVEDISSQNQDDNIISNSEWEEIKEIADEHYEKNVNKNFSKEKISEQKELEIYYNDIKNKVYIGYENYSNIKYKIIKYDREYSQLEGYLYYLDMVDNKNNSYYIQMDRCTQYHLLKQLPLTWYIKYYWYKYNPISLYKNYKIKKNYDNDIKEMLYNGGCIKENPFKNKNEYKSSLTDKIKWFGHNLLHCQCSDREEKSCDIDIENIIKNNSYEGIKEYEKEKDELYKLQGQVRSILEIMDNKEYPLIEYKINEDRTYRPYFSDKWEKRLTELGYDSHLKEDLERFINDGEKNIRKSLYEIDIKDRRQGRIGD